MSQKKRIRIFCVGDELVLLENDIIIQILEVEREDLEEEILKQIKNKGPERITVSQVFCNSIKALFPQYKFVKKGYKYQGQTIHDSSFYKSFFEFILEGLGVEKKREIYKEIKVKKKESLNEQRPYLEFKREKYIKNLR